MFLECAGHAKDGAAGWSSGLPARSSEQFKSLSSSQKGELTPSASGCRLLSSSLNLAAWSHPLLPTALAALSDVLVARYRHWRCFCCCFCVLIVLHSKDAVAAHVPYRNSKLTHMLQVVLVPVVVMVVMVVMIMMVMVTILMCVAVQGAIVIHANGVITCPQS